MMVDSFEVEFVRGPAHGERRIVAANLNQVQLSWVDPVQLWNEIDAQAPVRFLYSNYQRSLDDPRLFVFCPPPKE
jgi:hypothetical protein